MSIGTELKYNQQTFLSGQEIIMENAETTDNRFHLEMRKCKDFYWSRKD